MKTGFDNEKYIRLQSEKIRERIAQFGGKLYLEFGGKLFDDYHASRVLPGFEPDSKIRMLRNLRNDVEIVIAINAADIEKNKMRGDLGITYDDDVLRLMDIFRNLGFYVGSVVITRYNEQAGAIAFRKRLSQLGIRSFLHYSIEGYPNDIAKIVSEEGFGKNEYITTSKPLVVVTGPGPGSGKMATCLSQLYHEHKRGICAGYAKFETFPVWNLPLEHPVNDAYEAATADLDDVNMVDPFHLEAYGETAINYNRDVENFPVLKKILGQILGTSPYQSPTDMGVNMAGFCITDNEAVCAAARREILRRWYHAMSDLKRGLGDEEVVKRIKKLMDRGNITPEICPNIGASLLREQTTGGPAAAMELPDGRIVTGKTSSLLGAAASLLLNALKALADIDQETDIIDPHVLEPICALKTSYLQHHNPRLHSDEVLIALAISSVSDPLARKAQACLGQLKHSEAHFSVIPSNVDEKLFKKLGVELTSEPKYELRRLYHQ